MKLSRGVQSGCRNCTGHCPPTGAGRWDAVQTSEWVLVLFRLQGYPQMAQKCRRGNEDPGTQAVR